MACIGASVFCCTLGCPPPQTTPTISAPPPPPRELSEIVQTIEQNAALLDRALWSNNVHVTARFEDADGKEHVFNLDGNLLYQPPQNLRLDLRPGLGDQVMQIGSNAQDYWVWIEPELHRMWWGRYRHLHKPCTEKMPVRPDQLLFALGVGGLPKATDTLYGPARKFGRQRDILYYIRPKAGGGFLIDREYWVDRTPPYQIRVVILRDRFGQITMSALLDDYRPAWSEGPLVAHTISIIWPQDDGKFTMFMDSVRGVQASEVRPGSFERPTDGRLPAPVRGNVLQIDADCDQDRPAHD